MTNKIIKTSLCSFISAAIIFSIFLQGCSEDKSTGIYGRKGEISSGVNIHFTTGHEKDLDMIRDAGIRFVRMDFVWHDIEKERENYDWSAYDELTSNLKKRGLKALFILDYSNPLYEPEGGPAPRAFLPGGGGRPKDPRPAPRSGLRPEPLTPPLDGPHLEIPPPGRGIETVSMSLL